MWWRSDKEEREHVAQVRQHLPFQPPPLLADLPEHLRPSRRPTPVPPTPAPPPVQHTHPAIGHAVRPPIAPAPMASSPSMRPTKGSPTAVGAISAAIVFIAMAVTTGEPIYAMAFGCFAGVLVGCAAAKKHVAAVALPLAMAGAVKLGGAPVVLLFLIGGLVAVASDLLRTPGSQQF